MIRATSSRSVETRTVMGARITIGENVGLNLFIENLADVQYEKVNRIYSPGRTYRVGVSANF